MQKLWLDFEPKHGDDNSNIDVNVPVTKNNRTQASQSRLIALSAELQLLEP